MNTKSSQIALLFNVVINEYNNTAKSFSLWLKKNGIKGWGEATISNTRKGKCSPIKELNLIRHLTDYIEFLETQKNAEPTLIEPTNILDNYLCQKFYLYHHGYDDDTGEQRISRLVLEVGNVPNKVSLFNIKHNLTTDYVGTVEMSKKDNHLIFRLETARFHEKLLELIFIRPSNDKISEIMVGGYINIDIKGAIKLGTVILYHLKIEEEATPKGITYTSEECHKVPEPIRDFLKEKSYNRLKVTTGIYSLNDLRKFIFDHRNKK